MHKTFVASALYFKCANSDNLNFCVLKALLKNVVCVREFVCVRAHVPESMCVLHVRVE